MSFRIRATGALAMLLMSRRLRLTRRPAREQGTRSRRTSPDNPDWFRHRWNFS